MWKIIQTQIQLQQTSQIRMYAVKAVSLSAVRVQGKLQTAIADPYGQRAFHAARLYVAVPSAL